MNLLQWQADDHAFCRDGQKDLKAKVMDTGGWARLIASESQAIHEVDDLLTLKGLKIIYQRNLPRGK
jgi:pantothenate kinase type III